MYLFHTLFSFIVPFSHLVFNLFSNFSIIHTIFYLWSTLIQLFLSFSLFFFLSTLFRSSAAFSSGCKRTNHHKSTPLLLLRRENEGKREGRGDMGDAGEEKKRKRGGGISNLRARATGPNEQMDKMKGGERGSLGGAEDVTINEENLQFRS